MLEAINQIYIIGHSSFPGITAGEVYNWNKLLDAAVAKNLITLSSKQNFFIYGEDGKKVLTATAIKENN